MMYSISKHFIRWQYAMFYNFINGLRVKKLRNCQAVGRRTSYVLLSRLYAQPFYVLRKTKFYAGVKKGVCAPSYVIPKLYLHLWSNLWKGCRIDLFTRFPLYIVGWCITLRSPKIIMFLFIEVQIYEKYNYKSMNYNYIYWIKQA